MGNTTQNTSADTSLWRDWRWTFAFGILSVIAGTVGLSSALFTTLVSIIFFAALLMTVGIMYLVEAIRGSDHRQGSRLESALLAILYIVMAIAAFIDPVAATVALTAILTGFFAFTGFTRLFYAWQRRNKQSLAWLSALTGVANLLLAGIVIWMWPISSFLLIGLLISVELILAGWTFTFAAWQQRKLQQSEGDNA